MTSGFEIRRPQKRLDRRFEEVAKAVGGGYRRLQMPLSLALAVQETVAGHRLGALEGGEGITPPSNASRGSSVILTSCQTQSVRYSQIVVPCCHRSANQTSTKCCLDFTTRGGYRMFHGLSGSALPPPTAPVSHRPCTLGDRERPRTGGGGGCKPPYKIRFLRVAPGIFSFLAQTKMSWRSPLTSQYSR